MTAMKNYRLPIARLAFLLPAGLLALSAPAQSTEYSLQLNSGLFRFAGESANRYSQINQSNFAGGNYTNSPYGARPALSAGVSAQWQRITTHHLLLGLNLGAEWLRSKVLLNRINGLEGNSVAATGQTIYRHSFITAHPHLGWRFPVDEISIDITAGPELGYNLGSHERGQATGGAATVTTDKDRGPSLNIDLRLRGGVAVNYRRYGGYAGYSHGLSNYMGGLDGGSPEASARLLRFGLTYRLN